MPIHGVAVDGEPGAALSTTTSCAPGMPAMAGGIRPLERHLGAGEVAELGERARTRRSWPARMMRHAVAELLDLGQDVAREQHGGARPRGGGRSRGGRRPPSAGRGRSSARRRCRGRRAPRSAAISATFCRLPFEYARPFLRGSNWNASHEPLLLGRVGGIAARGAAQPREKVDRLAAGEVRPEADVARHGGDAAVQGDGVAPGILPKTDASPPVVRASPSSTRIVVDLPAPFGPEEAVDLPLFDVEVEPVEGVDAAVVLGEAAGVDDCGHARDVRRFHEFVNTPHAFLDAAAQCCIPSRRW